jgi:hypothetical protein
MVTGERRKVRPIKLVFPYGADLQKYNFYMQKRQLFIRPLIQLSLNSTPCVIDDN